MGRRNSEKEKKTKEIYDTSKKTSLIFDILLIVLGLSFIIWAEKALDLMTRIVGVLLVGVCVAVIVAFFKSKTREFWEKVGLGVAVLLGVFGIWLLISPGSFHGLINLVFGLLICVYGAFGIVNSVGYGRKAGGLWWIGLIMSIMAVSFAILILINPGWLSAFIMTAIGFVIVFLGITGIFNWFNVRKAMRIIKAELPIELKSVGSDDEPEDKA